MLLTETITGQNGLIDHELRFDCESHDIAKCNPFAISNPVCIDYNIYKNNWRTSHGSPQLRTFTSNNPEHVAVLKAKNTTGIEPKGEGMFIDYEFKGNHMYSIEMAVRVEVLDYIQEIKITAKAANGLVAKTNSNDCELGTIPTISTSNYQTIFDKKDIEFGTGSQLYHISISDFTPTKNYSFLWVYSESSGLGNEAEMIINYLTVTDVTEPTTSILNNNICCDQGTGGSYIDPNNIVGSTPLGGTGAFSYQWKKKTSGSWVNISGATGKDYNPPGISTTTNYMRVVTSGTESDNSNEIKIAIGDPDSWKKICCDQDYEFPSTPNELTSLGDDNPTSGYLVNGYQWASPYWVWEDVNAVNPDWEFIIDIFNPNWDTTAYYLDPANYQPPKLNVTTTYQRAVFTRKLGTDGWSLYYDLSNIITITIHKFLLESETFAEDTFICDPREIVIDGDIEVQNSNLEIISGTSILIKPGSSIMSNSHVYLNIDQQCTD